MPQPGPDRTRRTLLTAGAAALGLTLLPGCHGRHPLRLVRDEWIGYQFIALALREGLISADQLEYIDAPVDRKFDFIERNRAGAVLVTLDELMLMRASGADVVGALVFNRSAGADALLMRPEAASLDQLAGKRIGAESSTIGRVMLYNVLEAAGLEVDDITVVPIGGNHFSGWQENELDGIIAYQPFVYQLEQLGLQRVIDSRDLRVPIIDLLAVGEQGRGSHADHVRAIIDAHFAMLEAWQRNPTDMAYRLGALIRVPSEQVRLLLAELDLPDRDFNRHLLSAPAESMYAAVDALNPILMASGDIDRPLAGPDLFSAAFL